MARRALAVLLLLLAGCIRVDPHTASQAECLDACEMGCLIGWDAAHWMGRPPNVAQTCDVPCLQFCEQRNDAYGPH